MNQNCNHLQQASQLQHHGRIKSKRILSTQEREEKQRQQRLQNMAFEQRFNMDLEEKLKDYEYITFIMSDKTHSKDITFQTPRQNVQHVEVELHSSIEVVVPEQLQEQENNRKKKCRGDRKKQRYRRQLHNQGLNSATVAKLVEKKFPSAVQQKENKKTLKEHDLKNIEVSISSNQTTKSQRNNVNNNATMDMETKRKRILLTPTPTAETISILDKPLSQLSISQGVAKKTKTTTVAETTSILDKSFSQISMSEENAKKTKATIADNQVYKEHNELSQSYLENFKPRYLKVSNRIFKQMLSDAIENASKLIVSLNTSEKLHTVREMTEVTNNLYFKDFQEKLWQEYYNISFQDNNWESKITKHFARQHNTCQMYRPRKSYIQERFATIAKQKERIRKQLDEYLNKLLHDVQEWQPPIDGYLLTNAINECVLHSQKRLKEEFQYKKEMLKLDSNDHQLLRKFYELKPNEELIQLAQQIWQVAADEQKTKEQQEILRQRIYLKRLPSKTDQMINQLLNDSRITLSNPFLDPDQRASFASRCSKTIIQCKFSLMIVELDEFAIVTHRYDLTLTNLKEKLLNLNKENPLVYKTELKDIIEERRQAMIQRFIRMRQHKLKTFFDQAPTVDNN
ncbi:unnamed protein product [Rotaria sordida]|uniref:Uncharacterized protein n=1 Tax=Rotaria sordida TaxID=392033 RepID=A0A815SHG3_9BILA|nr:unnamed protein product [Rotaria sordida]